jgi:hypothetical protein
VPSPERFYHASVRVFSVLFIVLGLAILGFTFGEGGGPLSVGVLMGVAFLAVGCGRLLVASRMQR